MKDIGVPKFYLALSILVIPSVISMSEILGIEVIKKISEYSKCYCQTLIKHLLNETEVQLIDGNITENSRLVLSKLGDEMGILQYRSNLQRILSLWKNQIRGQPIYPAVHNILADRIETIMGRFQDYVYRIQKYCTRVRFGLDNSLGKKVCETKTSIINLTDKPIPTSLKQMFAEGPNSVPHEILDHQVLQKRMENDLMKAAISVFRSKNYYYPRITETASLKTVLEQLISQSPSNTSETKFFCTLYESYLVNLETFKQGLTSAHFSSNKSPLEEIPKGTILSLADKGLGLVLLPISWYIDQYKVQSQKGGHIQTNMSNDQCLALLRTAIQTFRRSLEDSERQLLGAVYSKPHPKVAIGVLRLVPKIHKVKTLNTETWKMLPSRPIRGAENCPINPYSKSLCKLLQELHGLVKAKMSTTYPIILGCEEYANKIHQTKYPASQWSMNTLLTADFADAYTKSSLEDLQGAISKLGHCVKWPSEKIGLSQKLSKLVFENCYFETPSGIQRQSQGFPMGGHCSREGLDSILLSCEMDLLESSSIMPNLYFYHRLVDDISAAVNGKFDIVHSLVKRMAAFYPQSMPLNIQISFGYSHFLDCHVLNMLQPGSSNSFSTSLAYKPLSRFEYVPFSSNIASRYKGNIMH